MKRIALARKCRSGYSIIELVIVCAIVLVIAAMALPSISRTLQEFKLRSTMSQVSGLLQNCRSNAVRKSKVKALHFTTKSEKLLLYTQTVEPGVDAGLDKITPSEDQLLYLPKGFARAAANEVPVQLDPNVIWGPASSSSPLYTDMAFTPRGLPCDPSKSPCDPMKGFIYYFNYTPDGGRTNYVAATVSPMGRIKLCYLNDSKTAWMASAGGSC